MAATGFTTKSIKTLRCRMLLVAAICVVSTLAVAGAALVMTYESHLLTMIGRDLDQRWATLSRQIAIDAKGEPDLIDPSNDPRYLRRASGAYWQVSEGGRPALRSRSLGERDLDLSDAEPTREDGKWFEVDAEDGHELYVVERNVDVETAGGAKRTFKLAVAVDHEQIASARGAFMRDVAVVLGLIALVLVLASGLQLRVILQPLSRLRRELGAIREGRQARLGFAAPAEIAPLAEDLNRLLDGQEQLVKKARERAGALAHGLKTPLAILTAEARRLDEEGQSDVSRRLREQISGIQTHVERELARARAHGASAALGALVDASSSAERLVRVMARMPRGETISWRCEAPETLMLRMDPDDFGEVLGNLLDNARKWATSSVTLRCEVHDASARVIVQDDGPGFGSNATPPSLIAGDRENSAGLGLVIVQDILAAYGSALWIDRAASNGIVSFTLPGKVAASAQADRERRTTDAGFSFGAPRGHPAQGAPPGLAN